MSEQWKPVVGFEGHYEVSDQGRVRSLGRMARVRKLAKSGRYLQLTLKAAGRVRVVRAHILVAEAFIGPRPEGMDICHNNGDGTDNRLENLRYDTRAENARDVIRHGTNWQMNKTHCPRGHEYTPENTANWTGGKRRARYCRTCDNARKRVAA